MERWESEAAEGGIYRKFGYRMHVEIYCWVFENIRRNPYSSFIGKKKKKLTDAINVFILISFS
jgi:hypothetical protein